jgi:hypothetical protein
MRQRRIGADLVHVTVQEPDWKESSVAGRVNRWKRVEGRFLRVTCRDERERVVVISVAFKIRDPRRSEKP